ncbi:MAG: protein-L-isoaspartate(D-aspartate) O-methyltransferase [Prolixibacteraceae bacterium]
MLILILISGSCSSANQEKEKKNNTMKVTMQIEQSEDTASWRKEANKMVNSQLVSRGISDKNVLRVMRNTPRHLFVPGELSVYAYDDGPLPIGQGQTISQPFIVAIMTQLLELKGDEKVLEIGTGSGYQAAVLAQLVDTCYSIELVKPLADSVKIRLNRLGYNNVVVKCGDGYQGWPKHAPFDCIIITAAPESIPEKLVEQLKSGGKMVLPVGKYYQQLVLVTKTKRGIARENIIPVRFVPMVKPE